MYLVSVYFILFQIIYSFKKRKIIILHFCWISIFSIFFLNHFEEIRFSEKIDKNGIKIKTDRISGKKWKVSR